MDNLIQQLDDWSFSLLVGICFLVMFMILFQLKPISFGIAEGLIGRR